MRQQLLLLIFISCYGAVHVVAQTYSRIDSLQQLVKKEKDNENKVLLLIQIGQEYENSDLEKSKYYYYQARILGQKINYPLTEVKFVSNYTFALNMQGKYDSSLYWNLKGIEAAKKLDDDEHLAKAYFNTGTTYQYMSDFPSAVEYYQKGLALFEKIDDKRFKAQASDILQSLYTSMKQYDRAKKYGNEAVATFRFLNEPKMLAYALSNLGHAYGKNQQIDSAKIFYLEAERIATTISDEVLLTTINLNLSHVFFEEKQLAASKKYTESALHLAEQNDLPDNKSIALRGLSYYYFYTGDYAASLHYAEQAVSTSKKYNIRNQTVLNLEQLALLAFVANEPWKGKAFQREATLLRDSLLSEEILQTTINTEKKYELDKKNDHLAAQEESIEKQQMLNGFLIGGIALLALVLSLAYRNYNQHKKLQQQKINELETEKQLLATQSVLKGVEEERSRIAKDLHDGLGGLLSGVKLQLGAMKGNLILTEENGIAFNRVLHNLEDSIAEMRRVAHNMMPETLLKFGLEQALTDYSNSLSHQQHFTIQCTFRGLDKRLDKSTEVVIYRIVQELLNNAVKHSGADTILVQLMRHDEAHINITVEDNGKGYQPNEAKENSAGLKNIVSRVKYLNGKMDIQSSPGKGTSVFIECELKS